MSDIWIIINHWVHLFAAAALVGGTIFMRLAVHPSVVKTLSGDNRVSFERMIRRKSAGIIHGGMLLLLITGFINLTVRFNQGERTFYMMIFMLKFILAMIAFGIAVALVVPSDALEKFQSRRPFWLFINILLALAVLFLSSWLRNISGNS